MARKKQEVADVTAEIVDTVEVAPVTIEKVDEKVDESCTSTVDEITPIEVVEIGSEECPASEQDIEEITKQLVEAESEAEVLSEVWEEEPTVEMDAAEASVGAMEDTTETQNVDISNNLMLEAMYHIIEPLQPMGKENLFAYAEAARNAFGKPTAIAEVLERAGLFFEAQNND